MRRTTRTPPEIPAPIDQQRRRLRSELAEARRLTDQVFQQIRPDAIYERSIPERHRFIFYLGHLEAFDWNMVCAHYYGMDSLHPEFDRLFAFGIDPTNGQLPQDKQTDWPSVAEITQYNNTVRQTVDGCFEQAAAQIMVVFHALVEHRLMHAETLAYMLHALPFELKVGSGSIEAAGEAPQPRQVRIPTGWASLGLEQSAAVPFGWDNEFQPHQQFVPEFLIDAYNVTNSQYLKFVRDGGYEHRSLWSDDAWNWLTVSGQRWPQFWRKDGDQWWYQGMFAEVPLPLAAPVYVSHAEASAYARWAGKALPSEAQYHRAAFASANGSERLYPWGDDPPAPRFGNFDFQGWDPAAVDAYPDGNSAFGVSDLMSNGWEWTSTVFAPFPGFQAFDFYPGYSAAFFDGKHYVLKGASPRTSATLMRKSFRNWFQALYPHIYATFRCVEH